MASNITHVSTRGNISVQVSMMENLTEPVFTHTTWRNETRMVMVTSMWVQMPSTSINARGILYDRHGSRTNTSVTNLYSVKWEDLPNDLQRKIVREYIDYIDYLEAEMRAWLAENPDMRV